MVKFIFVKIAYRAPTIDGDYMPLWLYDRPLYVIKEEDTVVVRCNNNEFYTYERVYRKHL